MKRILFIIPLICLLSACNVNMDTVFDESSQERLQKAAAEARRILLGADNGWVMEYYPDASQWGGFNLVVQFFDEEDRVVMYTGEEINPANPLPRSAESTWSILADRSLGLGFDTYNDILHEIIYSGGLNMDGDFDFRLVTIEPDRIEMIGRRKNSLIVLTPLPENTAPGDYYDVIEKTKKDIMAHGFILRTGSTQYEIPPYSDMNYLTVADAEGKTIISTLPFNHTPAGIRFYEPILLDGKELSEFRFDASLDVLVSTSDDNVILEKIYMTVREYFLASYGYYFNHNEGKMSDRFRTEVFNLPVFRGSAWMNWMLLGRGSANVYGVNFEMNYTNNYISTMLFDFNPVEGYENRLELYYLHDYVGTNAGGWDKNVAFAEALANETLEDPGKVYELSADDPLLINEIKFVRIDDPDLWFILSKSMINVRNYYENL